MNKLNFAKRACAVLALCAATATTLQAQTFGVLHSFDGTDGSWPEGWLIQATDGNLYGTAGGGAYGWGTIFKITPSGTLTTLYSFCSQSGCPDGTGPSALIQATDGNFYGTTVYGGSSSQPCSMIGCGTIFKITSSGTLTTLYSFCLESGCPDGDAPGAPLVQATDGNFYGTTNGGGAYGYGTVFKVTPGGTLTTLYSFCSQANCTDGEYPSGLIQATDGNLYGAAHNGGANFNGCYGPGCGTVFKITLGGALTTLYSFCSQVNCTDGGSPSGLIQATDGNFYGTTVYGGSGKDPYGYAGGTVFRITRSATLSTLYNFCSQRLCTDGLAPVAALIQATDGNLYGTTEEGGTHYNSMCGSYGLGCGTIFRISTAGQLTTLYSFCQESNCTDGVIPLASPLVQDTDGSFYGTAPKGGMYGDGTVFVLSTGLAPFVETQPNHGKAGRVIKILGTNLGGASSVTFNGTPAVFKVVSYSLIAATVPAGATTGTVQVTTPSGVLSSNVPFRVVQ